MVDRGGIWDGTLDTWSSMAAAATVQKRSLRQIADQCSRLGAPAAESSRKAFSADCITSIDARHNGRYFYALQVFFKVQDKGGESLDATWGVYS
jgi:hypothetical protein